ncbi:MAG: helix-turn-helix domain-containing protein [Phycisphaerae bacterium]|nr:helix-turn-helix domain-containing protein [Phycisphaerae bacterium]
MATKTNSTAKRRRGRARQKELTAPPVAYTMALGDGRTVYVEVPGRMVVRDRAGQLAFTPEGVRFLDRIRALASRLSGPPSPAFLTSLREAAGLSQEQLGKRIGRDKLTVSRWECGRLKPGRKSLQSLNRVFARLKKSGVVVGA